MPLMNDTIDRSQHNPLSVRAQQVSLVRSFSPELRAQCVRTFAMCHRPTLSPFTISYLLAFRDSMVKAELFMDERDGNDDAN